MDIFDPFLWSNPASPGWPQLDFSGPAGGGGPQPAGISGKLEGGEGQDPLPTWRGWVSPPLLPRNGKGPGDFLVLWTVKIKVVEIPHFYLIKTCFAIFRVWSVQPPPGQPSPQWGDSIFFFHSGPSPPQGISENPCSLISQKFCLG